MIFSKLLMLLQFDLDINLGTIRGYGKTSKKKTAYFMTSGKKVGGPRTKTKFQKKI